MAEVTKIVDVDAGGGEDYTSLSAWEAGEDGIDQGGDDPVASCRNTSGSADTTAVNIGTFTNAGKIIIRVESAYLHDGAYDTGAYRLETADSCMPISNAVNNIEIYGMQFKMTLATDASDYCLSSVNGDVGRLVLVDRCILWVNDTITGTKQNCINANDLDDWYFRNCTMYSRIANDHVMHIRYGAKLAHNCTLYGGDWSTYALTGGTQIFYNCIADEGNGGGFDSGAGGDYNWSSNDDAPGANSRGQTDADVTYVTEGSDFHLDSGDEGALDYGTDLYSDATLPVTEDIDGQSRDGLTFDIGSDEYISGAFEVSVNEQPSAVDAMTPQIGDIAVNVADCPKPIDKVR